MQAQVRTGTASLENRINNYKKPKSQLVVESREECAKTYLEEVIIEMET